MLNQDILEWCQTELGSEATLAEQVKERERSSVYRLRIPALDADIGEPSFGYLKVHENPTFWAAEVHGYREWAPLFTGAAPKLLAYCSDPLITVISELPGLSMPEGELTDEEQCRAWQAAGQHLAKLHRSKQGDWFGPCQADGRPESEAIPDAPTYIANYLDEWFQRGLAINALSPSEQSIVQAAYGLIPAFASEPAVPCHRDYCPVNWLVNNKGQWAGVIDFEFAQWDVRIADFTRYPDWEWIHKPHLIDAFFDGYGHKLTTREEEQRFVGHVQYALSAIVWGQEALYFGFKQEGQEALAVLGRMI